MWVRALLCVPSVALLAACAGAPEGEAEESVGEGAEAVLVVAGPEEPREFEQPGRGTTGRAGVAAGYDFFALSALFAAPRRVLERSSASRLR